jgi:hypothetical protein
MIKAFLSSTSKDLEPYRQRAKEAINGIDGYHCVAMENFGARDSPAEVFCPEKVEGCDLFILLLGLTDGRVYTKSVDVIWEALWLMCKRMDEQRL